MRFCEISRCRAILQSQKPQSIRLSDVAGGSVPLPVEDGTQRHGGVRPPRVDMPIDHAWFGSGPRGDIIAGARARSVYGRVIRICESLTREGRAAGKQRGRQVAASGLERKRVTTSPICRHASSRGLHVHGTRTFRAVPNANRLRERRHPLRAGSHTRHEHASKRGAGIQ
jgi:hypothetical protein